MLGIVSAVVLGIAAFYLALGFTGGFIRVVSEDECPDNGACAPSNDEPVPNVVGIKVEDACRELGEAPMRAASSP